MRKFERRFGERVRALEYGTETGDYLYDQRITHFYLIKIETGSVNSIAEVRASRRSLRGMHPRERPHSPRPSIGRARILELRARTVCEHH